MSPEFLLVASGLLVLAGSILVLGYYIGYEVGRAEAIRLRLAEARARQDGYSEEG